MWEVPSCNLEIGQKKYVVCFLAACYWGQQESLSDELSDEQAMVCHLGNIFWVSKSLESLKSVHTFHCNYVNHDNLMTPGGPQSRVTNSAQRHLVELEREIRATKDKVWDESHLWPSLWPALSAPVTEGPDSSGSTSLPDEERAPDNLAVHVSPVLPLAPCSFEWLILPRQGSTVCLSSAGDGVLVRGGALWQPWCHLRGQPAHIVLFMISPLTLLGSESRCFSYAVFVN